MSRQDRKDRYRDKCKELKLMRLQVIIPTDRREEFLALAAEARQERRRGAN